MEFRTKIEPLKKVGLVQHSQGVMLMGSCFSDNIGDKLSKALFDADVNPFGPTFNPMSIHKLLERVMAAREFKKSELRQDNGLWNSPMVHSKFSSTDADTTLEAINSRLLKAHDNLKKARVLILTWGTSYVFYDKAENEIVNNCHKRPAADFERRRVSVDEIVAEYENLFQELIKFNSSLNIIITVSPIRHLADGLDGNQLSKSILRVAAGTLAEKYAELVTYFPSYEAVVDDLRDYRFYASDMVHTSEVAETYIYNLFLDSFCSKADKTAAAECEKFNKRLSHRMMNADAEMIDVFHKATRMVFSDLKSKYPYLGERVDIEKELQ